MGDVVCGDGRDGRVRTFTHQLASRHDGCATRRVPAAHHDGCTTRGARARARYLPAQPHHPSILWSHALAVEVVLGCEGRCVAGGIFRVSERRVRVTSTASTDRVLWRGGNR